MTLRWTRNIGLLAVLFISVFIASPAAAVTSVELPLNQGHKGAKAATFTDKGCDIGPSAMPLASDDVWVFVLPGKGEFTQLTVKFGNGSVINTLSIPAFPSSGIVTDKGASKAWIAVPAGWTLLDASAVVTSDATKDFFNLTHTCPTTGDTSEQGGHPETGTSPSAPEPSASSGVASPSPGAGSDSPAPSAVPGGFLPVTGAPAAVIGGLGVVMLVAGGMLVGSIRRRRATRFTA